MQQDCAIYKIKCYKTNRYSKRFLSSERLYLVFSCRQDNRSNFVSRNSK